MGGGEIPLPNDLELRIMIKMWCGFFLFVCLLFFFSWKGAENRVKDTQNTKSS